MGYYTPTRRAKRITIIYVLLLVGNAMVLLVLQSMPIHILVRSTEARWYLYHILIDLEPNGNLFWF